MKRIATWVFYAIGGIAILYLALYAYTAFTGHGLEPGDPIHIFRKPDAPNYSAASQFRREGSAKADTSPEVTPKRRRGEYRRPLQG